MSGRMVQLTVGGQTYRVVSSASADELYRLADVVDDKLSSVMPPGRAPTPQAMLLAAIALAHEAEEQRNRADAMAAKAKEALGRVLGRVDDALRHSASGSQPEEVVTRARSDSQARSRGVGEPSSSPSSPPSSPLGPRGPRA